MLALKSSFSSYLVPIQPPVLPEFEAGASRIMQFDSKGKCQTPEIAFAIISVLKSQTTQLTTKVTIFRNALVCGYERALLDRIEDQVGVFEPDLALRSALEDEGIVLEKREGRLWLSRLHVTQETDPAVQLAAKTLSELGLPKDVVRLIATKARITPKEKIGAIEQYLGQNISGWTRKQLNDALLAAFKIRRPLPEGQKRLEITNFYFSIPIPALTEKTGHSCIVPRVGIKLIHCYVRLGILVFSNGLVTASHSKGIPLASGAKAIAVAGVPDSTAKSYRGGTAIAIAPNSTAMARDKGSKAIAKVPYSFAIAEDFSHAKALAPSSSAIAYSGAWAIAGPHSSAVAINQKNVFSPPLTMTAMQYRLFADKSLRQRKTVEALIGGEVCTPSAALGLAEGVLDALSFSLSRLDEMDITGTKSLSMLLQNEKFMDELGSLTCRQQLKAGTLSLHDLVERYSAHSSGLLSSSSTMSTSSSSSSSTMSDMSS